MNTKSFFDKILKNGFEHIHNQSILRKLTVFNQIFFIVTVLDILLTITWLYFDGLEQSILVAIQFFVNIIVFFLIKKGKHLLGRSLGFATAILGVTGVAALSGRSSMTHLLLIYQMVSLFFVFDYSKEKKIIYSFLAIIFLSISILEFHIFDNNTILEFTESTRFFYLIHFSLSIFLFIVMKNITLEFKQFENKLEKNANELIKEKERAEQALQIKSHFLSNMSHEMRTPLNSIIGFTEIIKSAQNQSITEEYIQHVAIASENMKNLINDILDFSKFESDKFTIKKAPFSLNKLINEIFDLLKTTSNEKSLTFSKTISKNVSDGLIGDSLRLRQILLNLLSNAIKFTKKGGIELNITAKNNSDNHQIVTFKIIDTGIGIDTSNQSSIFEGFTQVDSEYSKAFKGTGLGLSIVRKLTDLMDGSLDLKSEPNKGSTFTLELLFETTKVNQQSISKEITLSSKAKGLSVLIVDDNPMNLLLLEKILSDLNFIVSLADDGKEALDKLKNNRYDLMLLDFQMPELSGIDVFTELKIDNETYSINSNLHTIIVTADIFNDAKKDIYNAGVQHIIHKPISKKELIQTINKLFD